MNVLLIGGGSRMTDAVIDKLNKGKHRIFLLTGRRDRQTSYKHVFQRYDYSYEGCFRERETGSGFVHGSL